MTKVDERITRLAAIIKDIRVRLRAIEESIVMVVNITSSEEE